MLYKVYVILYPHLEYWAENTGAMAVYKVHKANVLLIQSSATAAQ